MTTFQEQQGRLTPLAIALLYLAVAALWIGYSDYLLNYFLDDPDLISLLQTYKGWVYVLVTAAGLYYLIERHDRERQELNTELNLEEEMISKLFRRIPVMANIYDPELQRFRVNPEFERVLGWTTEDANRVDLMEVCFPDAGQREEVADFMDRTGTGWRELTVRAKDGTEVPSSWTNIRLSDNTRIGIGIDLSEVRASEAEIRESQRLLLNTFNSLQESVILVEPRTRLITDCNRATEEVFGYGREELVGQSTRMLHVDEEHFHEFDRRSGEPLDEKGTFSTEFRMRKKSGEVFASDHTVTMIYDEEGNMERVVSVVRDISESKRNREELMQRNAFIETTLEQMPIGVAVNTIDDGRTTLMNRKFSEIYGWPEEELQSVDDFFEKVYPDEEFRREIKQRVMEDMGSGDPDRMSWNSVPIVTKEGRRKFVDNHAIPLYEQNLMISTVIDVTERKRMQDRILQSVIEAEDRERRRMARELHDGIGQYLSAAHMNLNSIQNKLDDASSKVLERLETIGFLLKKAISESRAVAYNLMPDVLQEYGLVMAIRSLVESLDQSTGIRFNFDTNLDESILSTRVVINVYRIVQEALHNAVRHGACEHISIQLYEEEGTLRCTIEDDGRGVKLEKEDTRKGLGLRSMQNRVRSLSGTLEIDSTPGKGMTVLFEIPLDEQVMEEM